MAFDYPPSPHTIRPAPSSPHHSRHARQHCSPCSPFGTSSSPIPFRTQAAPPLRIDTAFLQDSAVDGRNALRPISPLPRHHMDHQTLPPMSRGPPAPSSGAAGITLRHTGSSQGGPSDPASRLLPLAVGRRQSRFDPMGNQDELDEDSYGELGHLHPLRRVAEEEAPKDGASESIKLPGFKAMFGASTKDHASTPPLYHSPSLPSLAPNSPSSSPSTARTSRYSSLASASSSHSDTFQAPSGWWAPDFDRSSQSPRQLPGHRANSFPSTQAFVDEHADKRRRSDGPPALRDAEESARLRWQAQSRNASFPLSSPMTPSSTGTMRSLLHPRSAVSTSMNRQSISGSSGFSSPLSPFIEHPGTPGEYPFDRRPTAPSRNSSIVGGQLAQSFADLTANEMERRSPMGARPSISLDMPPPSVLQDRRQSSFARSPSGQSPRRSPLPPMNVSRPPSTDPEASGRQSISRPSSPEQSARRSLSRRSSLTEAIMAKSGDDIAMASRRYPGGPPGPGVVPLARPFISEPISDTHHAGMPGPLITGWPVLQDVTTIPVGRSSISLNSDDGGPAVPVPGLDKRPSDSAPKTEDEDMDSEEDHAMRGMEVLAESARRVSEAESTGRSREGSPKTPGPGPKYSCSFCAKTFSRPSSLRIHTYSHTGERPYVCKEPSCRRRFSVQSNLKRHAKVHQMSGSGAAGLHGRDMMERPRSGHGEGMPPLPHHSASHPGHGPQGYYPQHPAPFGYGHSQSYDGYQRLPQPYGQGPPEHRLPPQHGKERVEEWDGGEDELDDDELEDEEP